MDCLSFSRGSSWPRNQTGVSCIAGRFFTSWTTREARAEWKGWKKKQWTRWLKIEITQSEQQIENSDSIQSLSRVWLFATPWTAACQAPLSITNSWSLLKLMSIASVMPSNHLILCHPFSSCLQSFPAQVFSCESVLFIRWPKYWCFSFSISPSKEYSGLISFRIKWWISLLSKGFSRVFSNTTLQKHQFFSAQLSL